MPAPLPLDHQLCFSLYAANMAVGRTYKPMLDALGLTYPQYLVLLSLWEQDGLDSSTVTPLVKRLEAAGLVKRTRNPSDERQVVVRLTDEGRAIRERCGCLGEALFEQSGMSLSDLVDLKARVQALLDGLCRRAT
jgi:DNA-binding MarR family transcriptional regulator